MSFNEFKCATVRCKKPYITSNPEAFDLDGKLLCFECEKIQYIKDLNFSIHTKRIICKYLVEHSSGGFSNTVYDNNCNNLDIYIKNGTITFAFNQMEFEVEKTFNGFLNQYRESVYIRELGFWVFILRDNNESIRASYSPDLEEPSCVSCGIEIEGTVQPLCDDNTCLECTKQAAITNEILEIVGGAEYIASQPCIFSR